MPNGLADRHRRLALPPVRVTCGGGAPPLATHGRAHDSPCPRYILYTHIVTFTYTRYCVSLALSLIRL